MFRHPIPPVLRPIRLLSAPARPREPPSELSAEVETDGALALQRGEVLSAGEQAHGREVGPLRLLEVIPPGRIVEVCGSARASIGARILAAVQARGELVAWVAPKSAGLFPPDLAAAGLDLDALLVVHVPEGDARAGPKAAELLLRTGAIGAVLLDATTLDVLKDGRRVSPLPRAGPAQSRGEVFRGTTPHVATLRSGAVTAWQGRLLGILREHDARLVILSSTEAAGESLGPLVSVRLALSCRRIESPEGRHTFEVSTRVMKDKSGVLAGRSPRPEVRRGPLGA